MVGDWVTNSTAFAGGVVLAEHVTRRVEHPAFRDPPESLETFLLDTGPATDNDDARRRNYGTSTTFGDCVS